MTDKQMRSNEGEFIATFGGLYISVSPLKSVFASMVFILEILAVTSLEQELFPPPGPDSSVTPPERRVTTCEAPSPRSQTETE